MTLAEVFDFCQEIELRHAKLYATLSILLGNVDERVARFWEQMSSEEWGHYMLVDFGRSLCAKTFGLDIPATQLPDVSIEQILDRLNEYEDRVNTKQITLNEGFEIAIAIEGGDSDTVYMDLLKTIREAILTSNQTLSVEPYITN